METLAYLHLALAYEASTDAETVLALEHFKRFAPGNRLKLSSSAWIPLLVVLAVLGMATQSLAELQLGDRGAGVSRLQERLRQRGYFNERSTGYFGSQTRDAVIRFQRSQGLRADGVAGAATQAALLGSNRRATSQSFNTNARSSPFRIVEFSSAASPPTNSNYSEETRLLQQQLRDAGFYTGPIDGIWGPRTQAAYSQWQIASGQGFDNNDRRDLPPQLDYYSPVETTAQRDDRTARVLQRGDRGDEVRRLQQRLRDKNFYYGSIDGVFGVETERAVRQFQYSQRLYGSGVLDVATRNALDLQQPKSRYVVVVPGGRNNTLLQVLRYVPEAYPDKSRRGDYIHAGAFDKRETAESRAYMLRSHQLNARVVYRR